MLASLPYPPIVRSTDQRIGTATFLPLDSLQTPSPESTERLRAAAEKDGRYRLAADVVRTSADDIRRAVLYAVGNAVVCDSLDVAREICFAPPGARRGEDGRIKAVTLGGAVISRAGTMTGGVTRDDTDRAGGRFTDGKLEELRSRKEALEARGEELDAEAGRGSGSHAARLEDLRNAMGDLRNREQYTKSDLEYTKKKLKEQATLLKSSVKAFAKLEKQAARAEEGVETANTAVELFRTAVRDAEEEHFAPFWEETGISDLRAYDEAIGKAREDFVKKRTDIREHLAKVSICPRRFEPKVFSTVGPIIVIVISHHERMFGFQLASFSINRSPAECQEEVRGQKGLRDQARQGPREKDRSRVRASRGRTGPGNAPRTGVRNQGQARRCRGHPETGAGDRA